MAAPLMHALRKLCVESFEDLAGRSVGTGRRGLYGCTKRREDSHRFFGLDAHPPTQHANNE